VQPALHFLVIRNFDISIRTNSNLAFTTAITFAVPYQWHGYSALATSCDHHHHHHASRVLGRPWLPQANVASDLYLWHPPANSYNPVFLRLPLPRQSIWMSVDHVLVDLQGLSTVSFYLLWYGCLTERCELVMLGLLNRERERERERDCCWYS
jgi:hypothetical protein